MPKFKEYVMFADFRAAGQNAPFHLPNVGDIGELKEITKGWNRIRVTRRLGQTKIELNGKVGIEEAIRESGPLKAGAFVLTPKVPTQFANIFVKKLK